MPFIIKHDTVSRIRKPDMSVWMDDHIVGSIEPFTFKIVNQDGNRSVIFGASDAACAVFTTDEPTLPIACMPHWYD